MEKTNKKGFLAWFTDNWKRNRCFLRESRFW